MKKRFFSCVVIAALMLFLSVGSVFAADDAGKNFISSKVGLGYQGMIVGSFLNGISVRGWIGDRVGLEASGFYGRADAEIDSGGGVTNGIKVDLGIIEAKAMYAFISRSYSKFYAGGKIGVGRIGIDKDTKINGSTFYTPGLFIGSEWSFPGLPEVGFNFDVGYSWLIYDNKLSNDGDSYSFLNLNLSGISATFGIHYYF
jgi:hypothetical protein